MAPRDGGLLHAIAGQNRLYIEWVYGRLSRLMDAVMLAAVPSRDTWQESAIEMVFGRTIACQRA
jgi:hypothetical protein